MVSPLIVCSLVALALLTAVTVPFLWHRSERRTGIDSSKAYAVLYAIIRYTIAFNLASFGWKKLLGLQFVVPEQIAAQPMNQQSGEWLTRYYFGRSFE